ncbi:hypothetical protein [Bacillus pinisoli]|uniref:hypothetical protein n=1 Tax=Bacillus pinisoli TaxID=2901866 RepID=UPI001FF16E4F|nr:hypothetical protein [Bacillus pinisoli]
MKQLSVLLLLALVCYSIYYDVSKGTLPVGNVSAAFAPQEVEVETNKEKNNHYLVVKVKAGDTVLSLVEQNQKGSLPVEISKVIADFKTLNEGVSPEKIQIGKEYKVPLYSQ